jgi:hypothetical protein
MTCTKQKSNKILLQGKKKKQQQQWQEKICKFGVEQIEGHREFYIHLYLLGIYQRRLLKKIQLICAPCVFTCEQWLGMD